MEIKYKGKVLPLKYTFNSFKYMEDLDLGILSELDEKPFKIVGMTLTLLMGAMNYRPKIQYDEEQAYEVLESISDEGNMVELLEFLIGELEKSSFFKNLQEKQPAAKPAKK